MGALNAAPGCPADRLGPGARRQCRRASWRQARIGRQPQHAAAPGSASPRAASRDPVCSRNGRLGAAQARHLRHCAGGFRAPLSGGAAARVPSTCAAKVEAIRAAWTGRPATMPKRLQLMPVPVMPDQPVAVGPPAARPPEPAAEELSGSIPADRNSRTCGFHRMLTRVRH